MKKPAEAKQSTPVTVITGYLGAGKTTLLRRLLEHAQREKIRLAVVMNEFGQVGIDGRVVRGKNIDLVELSGGCVCCSMSGEFEAALKELVAKAKPDKIVIETTGVAEPDAIVVDLQGLPAVRLDAVVAVADADALSRFPSLGRTGRMQLEMADLVLLNKTDLVNGAQRKEVKKNVREINSRAAIVECVRCGVRPEIVLGVNAPVKKAVFAKGKRGGAGSAHAAGKRAGGGHALGKTGFFTFEATRFLDRGLFNKLASEIPGEIYRAKGFVNLEWSECKQDGKYSIEECVQRTFLWNYVAGRSELEEWPDGEKTEIVFIGEAVGKARRKLLRQLGKALV